MGIPWIRTLGLMAVLGSGCLLSTFAESDTRPGPVEVPFRLHRDYIIVVKGSLAGLKERNFLIDTGAIPSVIDARLAKKLKLSGKREGISAFTGTTFGERVRLPNLELGPIRLAHLDMLTQDLRFIEQKIGVRIDAMIGLDVLGWSNLAIDYEDRKLHFGARIPDAGRIPWELGPGCMLLPVEIDGRRLRMMVDTGTPDLMFFDARFRDRFPQLIPTRKKKFKNINGAAALPEVDLPDLRIGDAQLGPRTAVLVGDESKLEFDGLLGLRSLGASRVYFDFNRQVMSWVRSAESASAGGCPGREIDGSSPQPFDMGGKKAASFTTPAGNASPEPAGRSRKIPLSAARSSNCRQGLDWWSE